MGEIETIGSEGTGTKSGRFLTYATIARGLVFTTGSRGYDPTTFDPGTESGVLPSDLADETRFALQRQLDVLEQADSGLDQVLKAAIFVNTDGRDDLHLVRTNLESFLLEHRATRPPMLSICHGRLSLGRIAVDVVATRSKHQCQSSLVYVLATSERDNMAVGSAIRSCLDNLEGQLRAVGCTLSDLVNVRTYLPEQQMTTAGYAEYNEIYREVFGAQNVRKKPARATVGVPTPTGTEVRIEALALDHRS